MKKRNIIILILILIIILLLGYSLLRDSIKMTGRVVENLEVNNIQYLGKWIDARQQGSYYANWNSIIRDESNRLHITYCSSGENFNSIYAPDWRNTTLFATDKVRYQYSNDNGLTWSNSQQIIQASNQTNFWEYNNLWKISRNWDNGGYGEYDNYWKSWAWYQKDSNSNLGTGWRTIMRNQENLFQGGCTNSLIYYKGKYYLYFETYSPPSGILAIHVARSNNPQGPYEIWTEDGWKLNPTNSTYKPVLNPAIRQITGAEEWLKNNYNNGMFSSEYWGAGQPRVTQKDEKIYLYFTDTTYWILWGDSQGIHEYGRLPNQGIPYHLVSISEDPTNFENNYNNRMVNMSGLEIWGDVNPKYFPESNKFYNFYLKDVGGQNKIIYRDSQDGVSWSQEKIATNALSSEVIDTGNPNQGIIETNPSLVLLSDKNGYGKLSDLYLTYSKEYILPNAPVGWMDTPNYKWYYGGMDIYGLKLNLTIQQPLTPTCTSFTYSLWTQCNSSALQSKTITSSNPSGCIGGTPENLIQQCLPPCTLSNWQSTDSVCLSSNTLTRTWTKIGNCNQTIGVSKPNSETISCTYVPNVITCTNFTYSNWSECFANGIQNRSLLTSTPVNCQAGNPILTQSCNYTAPIVNQDIPINPNENQNINYEENNNNQEVNNQNPEENGQTTPPINNKTQEQPINLTDTNKEPSSLKKFFIKFICKLSNLFNGEKYNSCVENYLK